MATAYAGVDISKWQANVDYEQLARGKIGNAPVEFAMLRYSYGKSKDTMFDTHYNGCKAAGIKVGVYHWLRAQTVEEAKAEAEWLAAKLKKYQFEYPVAIDFEDPDLFALGLTKSQYTAIVDEFGSALAAAGLYVILYTNPDTLENRLNKDILDRYELWLAHWVTNPASYGQTMWQYAALGTAAQVKSGNATRVGTVQGANGPCDVNWSYVDYETKIKKAGKNGFTVKQPATPAPTTKKTYFVVGTKVCESAAALTTAKNQLKALGYEYIVVEAK